MIPLREIMLNKRMMKDIFILSQIWFNLKLNTLSSADNHALRSKILKLFLVFHFMNLLKGPYLFKMKIM